MASQAVLGGEGMLASPSTAAVPPVEFPRAHTPTRPHILRSAARMIATMPMGAWAVLDILLLIAGVHFGYQSFVVGHYPPYAHVPMWQGAGILATTFVLASLVFGHYERETLLSRSRILTRTMLTAATAGVVTYAIIYVIMYAALSRRVTGTAIGALAVGGTAMRLVACYAQHRIHRNLAIVGPGILSNSLVRAFNDGLLSEYRLIGYVDDNSPSPRNIDDIKCLGSTAQLPDICRRFEIDDIVVGAEAAAHSQVMNTVLPCLRNGCRVTNEATFYEKATGQILVDEINPHWFLFADLQVHCQRRQALKRAFDLLLSTLSLLLILPLLPIIAILIKLDDRGPVFYSQTRCGQNGKPFRLYKFRTMKVGAETDQSIWAVKNDPRVTRVGKILRKTRLDELPQLYNVFIGRMSLVGPRPERPDFVVQLTDKIPYFSERHLVKPGITGWAQIGFRYGSSIEDAKRKLQFDLYYLKNMSLELDIMILLRTIGVFVRGAC